MMVKRSVLSFVLVSALGGGFVLMLGTNAVLARTLDNMEAEKLTYSALVSDSYHVSSHATKKTSYIPKNSNRPAAKRVAVHHVAYHPKRRGAAVIKRAVFHQANAHLLDSLSRLRRG